MLKPDLHSVKLLKIILKLYNGGEKIYTKILIKAEEANFVSLMREKWPKKDPESVF